MCNDNKAALPLQGVNPCQWKMKRQKLQIQGSKIHINNVAVHTAAFLATLRSTNEMKIRKKTSVEMTTESVSLLLRVVPKVLQLCMTAAGARGLQTVISIRVQPTEDRLTY